MVTTTPHRMPGTLPPQASGFVGREAELGLVRDLLTRSRLVTASRTACQDGRPGTPART